MHTYLFYAESRLQFLDHPTTYVASVFTSTSSPSPRNTNPCLAVSCNNKILIKHSLLRFFISACCLLNIISEQIVGNMVTCSGSLWEMEPSWFLNPIVVSFQLLNPLLINEA